MTPKQILDSFSDTLMQDERILSAQERALLFTLLQHASIPKDANPETRDAVRAVIASAVGETVAQRAFAVLGGSIVERILESSTLRTAETVDARDSHQPLRMSGPTPPSPSPGEPDSPGVHAPRKDQPLRTPGVPASSPGEPDSPGVHAPRKDQPLRSPDVPTPPSPEPDGPGVKAPRKDQPLRSPDVPTPPAPEPDGPGVKAPRKGTPVRAITATEVGEANVAVAERPESLPARCVVLDEFLAPQELEELTRFVIEHEADFRTSEVIAPNAERGVVNYDHRRSRVLMEVGRYENLIQERIKSVLPRVLEQLGIEPFTIAETETQITASNDGDFFHFHSDNGSARAKSRYLTFVYFFHHEPRQFEGGELLIHDAHLENGAYVSEGHQTIVPQQNQIVFFPCELLHEITPVKCPSGAFADSRFTLNGWLRR
jgi:Rps23 Pro-64 3,4-dihydroxylase Tpa1-like proline 4-hydroxylase